MDRSTDINELAAAFAAAQGEIENVERTHTAKIMIKEGGSYSYSYSDLSDILGLARPILSKHGLCLTGQPTRNGREVSFAPLLLHSSGQFIQYDALVLEAKATDPQSIGSAITYNRRYSIGSILNIASEADDDGNVASGNDAETGPKKEMPVCPNCSVNLYVIRGKPEYGGGFLCYAKKGGCGAKWPDDGGEAPGASFEERSREPASKKQDAKPKPADKPTPPPETTEYRSLANKLHAMGVKTPEDATAVINYAVAGVGKISDMRTLKGECQQIEKALTDCGKTGAEILEAIKKGTA